MFVRLVGLIHAKRPTILCHRTCFFQRKIIGLRTAIELLRHNVQVVLRSPRHPLHPLTCSQGAGGFWNPYHCDDPRTDRWALETLDEIFPLATTTTTTTTTSSKTDDNKTNESNDALVEILPTVLFYRNHQGPTTDDFVAPNYKNGQGGKSPLPIWSDDPRLQFQHLSIEMLAWQNTVYKLRIPTEHELKVAGYEHAWFWQSPVVDSPRMLQVYVTK